MRNNTRQAARRNQQSSSNVPMKAGMALFAGAAIGGAMMYLFDPKIGASRRRRISEAAQGAVDQGKNVLGAAIGTAAAHAGHMAEHLRSHLSDASECVSGMASDAAGSAMAAGSGIMGTAAAGMKDFATHAQDHAMHFADRQLRKIGNLLPHDREHHYVGQTTCALGSLALGAGAVYFFDPEKGSQRRSQFRGIFLNMIRHGGEMFSAAGRHLRDRMMGDRTTGDRMMGHSNEPQSVFSSTQGAMASSMAPVPSQPQTTTPRQSVTNLSA